MFLTYLPFVARSQPSISSQSGGSNSNNQPGIAAEVSQLKDQLRRLKAEIVRSTAAQDDEQARLHKVGLQHPLFTHILLLLPYNSLPFARSLFIRPLLRDNAHAPNLFSPLAENNLDPLTENVFVSLFIRSLLTGSAFFFKSTRPLLKKKFSRHTKNGSI